MHAMGSVVAYFPSMGEALGSILSTEKRKKKSSLKITALWSIFDLILVKMESVYQLFSPQATCL